MLDAKKTKGRRLFFIDHEGQSSLPRQQTVNKGREWKYSFQAYLPATTIHDKLTTIDIEVQYSLIPGVGRGRYNHFDLSVNIQRAYEQYILEI